MALSAKRQVNEKDGVLAQYAVKDAVTLYQGALAKITAAGYLAPCATESGAHFAGIVESGADNSAGAAGALNAVVKRKGVFRLPSSGLTIANIGDSAYAADDETITTTDTGNLQLVGKIVGYISATEAWVEIHGVDAVLGASVGTSEIEADAITSALIADDQVSLEHLDSGIEPSHVIKYAGEFTTAGGDANETISQAGILATDIVVVSLHTAGSSPVTIVSASASADQIDVVMSGDPSTDHVISYVVYRAAA